MALYEVFRTDAVAPGEFVNALVVAGGSALARKSVGHLPGVTAKNVRAERVDVAGQGTKLLTTYFDESPTLPLTLDSDSVGDEDDFLYSEPLPEWERELLAGN